MTGEENLYALNLARENEKLKSLIKEFINIADEQERITDDNQIVAVAIRFAALEDKMREAMK